MKLELIVVTVLLTLCILASLLVALTQPFGKVPTDNAIPLHATITSQSDGTFIAVFNQTTLVEAGKKYIIVFDGIVFECPEAAR